MIVEVTKCFEFCAAHHIEEYYGDCSKLHGHTWKLEVTVVGKRDNIGIVIDFKILKTEVESMILSRLDHSNLNEVLQFNPTAENIACWIFEVLNTSFVGEITLKSVKLYEGRDSYVTVYGG